MKPSNFPGRKNDRRKGALARLNKTMGFEPSRKLAEQAVLVGRIIPNDMARAIRTKKDRSAGGRLRA